MEHMKNDQKSHGDDFEAYEAYLETHECDPLDAELTVKIQRLTLERLQEFCERCKQNMNKVINDAIKDTLYDEGM